jgi:hypothetical protein
MTAQHADALSAKALSSSRRHGEIDFHLTARRGKKYSREPEPEIEIGDRHQHNELETLGPRQVTNQTSTVD